MPFLPELTAVAVLAIALLLFILSKIINNNASYKSAKQSLLAEHQQLRLRSNKLQEALSSYILENHVETQLLTDGYTYGDFLKHLQKNHIKNLSDKNYSKIKSTNNRLLLNNAKAIVKEQQLKLDEVENIIKNMGLGQGEQFTLLPSE